MAKFQHRFDKEAILTYMDITALFGVGHANSTRIKAYQNEADKQGSRTESLGLLNSFYNKNVCYLDLRGNYSFSFNCYNNFRDTLKLEFPVQDSEETIEVLIDYYENWPLLMLRDRVVQISNPRANIKLHLPIKDADRINADYFLQSYTHEFIERSESTRLIKCNDFDELDTIRNQFCESIAIKAWVDDDSKLGANLFFFKFTKTQNSLSDTDIFTRSGPHDTVFSANMKLLVGDDNLADGDFKVFLYAPENAPIAFQNQLDPSRIYYSQYAGLAQDMNNTTFFSFAQQLGYDNGRRLKYPFAMIQNGKYENSAFLEEFNYDPNSEEIGFLTALPLRVNATNLELEKPRIDFQNEPTDFLYYLNTQPQLGNTIHLDPKKFHAVTLTNTEYQLIKTLEAHELDSRYPVYLHVDNDMNNTIDGENFAVGRTTLNLIGLEFDTQADTISTKEVVVEDTNIANSTVNLNYFVNKS